MTECCLDNSLGFLQVPQGAPGGTGATGANGADGADGAAGANGADGIDGTSVLYSLTQNFQTANTGTWENAYSYSLPANELSADGDTLSIVVSGIVPSGIVILPIPTDIRITFDGANATSRGATEIQASAGAVNGQEHFIEVTLTRVSSTSLRVLRKQYRSLNVEGFAEGVNIHRKTLTALDFTQINDIELDIFQYHANIFRPQSIDIYKLKA